MPPRRRSFQGYGSTPTNQPPAKTDFPLPPPPDGQAPVRLPVGGQALPPQAPQPDRMPDDPNAMLVRLLQSLGSL